MSPKKLISVRVSTTAAAELSKLAEQTGQNQTDLIEAAIHEIAMQQEQLRIREMGNILEKGAEMFREMIMPEEKDAKILWDRLRQFSHDVGAELSIDKDEFHSYFINPLRAGLILDEKEVENWI